MIRGWRRFQIELDRGSSIMSLDDMIGRRVVVSFDAGQTTSNVVGAIVAQPTVVLAGAWRRLGMWTSREMTAQCPSGADNKEFWAREHLLTGACSCGIYVTKDRRPGQGTSVNMEVEAEVIGWGAYVEYGQASFTEGWRFEHVRIEALHIDYKYQVSEDVQRMLIQRYQVPLVIDNVPKPCCLMGTHSNELVRRVDDGKEVPICQLPKAQIQFMIAMHEAMGDNEFANKKIAQLKSVLNT